MLYDLSDHLQRENFLARASALARKGGVAELSSKKPRTLRQNAYLWLLVGYWGSQTGYSKEEAEQMFKWVNRDVFHVRRAYGKAGVEIPYVRSVAELSAEEASACIEKFRDWSANNDAFPLYLPTPEDHAMVMRMEVEASRCRQWM